MNAPVTRLSRRSLLGLVGWGAAGLALGGPASAQVVTSPTMPLPSFTGPDANSYWNSVNPFVSYPQKLPLLRMTDRGVQLETPRPYFLTPFTPNAAFYVALSSGLHSERRRLEAKTKTHAERYDEFWQCEHAIQRQEAVLIEDFKTQILRATRAIFKKCRTRSERVALAVALQNATYVTRWTVFHVEEAEEWLCRQLDTLG